MEDRGAEREEPAPSSPSIALPQVCGQGDRALRSVEITTVMAQLIVADVGRSVDFYSRLFGRPPDANPMDKLYEWHFDDAGAIQVYEEPDRAGRSGATIGVANLDAEVGALDAAGIAHEPLAEADYVRVVQIADPDLNRIVLTGAK